MSILTKETLTIINKKSISNKNVRKKEHLCDFSESKIKLEVLK